MTSTPSSNSKITIIGVSGKMGSGKDYIAKNFLVPSLKRSGKRPMILAFADILKTICADRYMLSYEELFLEKNEDVRAMMQRTADQVKRDFSPDFFIYALEIEMYKNHHRNDIDTFVITDVRYESEVEWIRTMGGKVVRVEPSRHHPIPIIKSATHLHSSETELDGVVLDGTIFNYRNRPDFIRSQINRLITT